MMTMADLPIPFSGPMVRALLREIEAPGTGKTQTRRVVDPFPYDPTLRPGMAGYKPAPLRLWQVAHGGPYFLPRYSVGDLLYVREHWRTLASHDAIAPRDLARRPDEISFEADPAHTHCTGRFRQGMHMPRWASRITLLVTEVRVERLQDCSEADAVAEGIIWQDPTDEDREWAKRYAEENGTDADIKGVWIAPGTRQGWGMTQEERNQPQWGPTAACAYRCLWDSINGPGAWALNPWVAAYSFRPILGNIDQPREAPDA